MIGVSIFILVGLGICGKWGSAQFLNHRPFPRYSLEDMPDTDFSCRDKILGGYYADRQTECQMFHVCVKVAGVGVQDFRFLCPNSTAFDQEHQICADWEDVDCDAATLYYSSDNFDLYRIGSGFESKAAKFAEDEETFALQRAETGDIRLNREHQTQRVNQQKESPSIRNRANNQQHTQQTNSRNNYNNQNDNNERDLFKGSSSSNFFNNRNAGKETDEYDDDSPNVNANQNEDRFQKKKLTRKPTTKQDYEEPHTARPNRPTGFVNNFAGSSITTTGSPLSTTNQNEQFVQNRGRQRGRVNAQQNTDNYRQNSGQHREDDGQYRTDNSGQYNYNNQETRYTPSTPAPFRHPQQQQHRQNNQRNNNNDQFSSSTTSTEKPIAPFISQQRQTYNNYNQAKTNPNYPENVDNIQTRFRQTENNSPTSFEKQTKVTENYPSTPLKQAQNQAKDTQSISQAPFKQTQNYSPTPFQNDKKESEAYTSTPFRNTQQYTIAPFHKESKVTEIQFSTPSNSPTQFQHQSNAAGAYSSGSLNQDQNRQKQISSFENYSTASPFNRNTEQYQNNYEITKNKQSDSSPQYFKKPTTLTKQTEYNPTTYSPKSTPFKTPTFSESYTSTTGYKNSEYAQNNQQNNPNNNRQTNYNQQDYRNTNTEDYSKQRDTGARPSNSQSSSSLNYNQDNKQSTQNIQYKQTTQYTQYTPTVPRITTPSYSSTTLAPTPKRSYRFDETQYDDGSYNSKYDKEDSDKKDDEFLKTAQSTNFASSRNEYIENSKNAASSATQKPRPFSVTPNPPNESTYTKPSPSRSSSPEPSANAQSQPTNNGKRNKDATYDYAYYDSNAGADHEYDIGLDIEKSNHGKNKKNA